MTTTKTETADIVERLRQFGESVSGGSFSPKDLAKEAADKIELLRKERDGLREERDLLQGMLSEANRAIMTLRSSR